MIVEKRILMLFLVGKVSLLYVIFIIYCYQILHIVSIVIVINS